MVEEQDWVFTFGVGQALTGKYVELHGTINDTREEMFRLFGNGWAFQYQSREDAGVDKWGLQKLEVASPMNR